MNASIAVSSPSTATRSPTTIAAILALSAIALVFAFPSANGWAARLIAEHFETSRQWFPIAQAGLLTLFLGAAIAMIVYSAVKIRFKGQPIFVISFLAGLVLAGSLLSSNLQAQSTGHQAANAFKLLADVRRAGLTSSMEPQALAAIERSDREFLKKVQPNNVLAPHDTLELVWTAEDYGLTTAHIYAQGFAFRSDVDALILQARTQQVPAVVLEKLVGLSDKIPAI